jgi:hypothetical protein
MAINRTPNLGLHDWLGTEYVKREEIVENFRKIDNEFGENGKIGILLDAGLDRISASSKFVTTMESWIGLVNTKYLSDLATRFYLLPKGKVTTGVGGCIKIFGDDYHNGAEYRDFGIYFHADQAGDKGYYNNGVFWLNSKVYDGAGSTYIGKNPDIGFSFQDGQVIAGRWVKINNYAVLVIGSGLPNFHGILPDKIKLEMQGSIGLRNDDGLYWKNAAGTSTVGIRLNTSDTFIISGLSNGIKVYTTGVEQFSVSSTETKIQNQLTVTKAIVRTDLWVCNADLTTANVANFNRVKFAQPNPNTITSLGGVDGQKITCLFTNGNTTIQHNSSIKLKGGVNYTGQANEILVLENFEGVWYEVSRSANHA